LAGGKKGRMRKDRYSSLLIANMIARQINRTLKPVNYDVIGSNARLTEKNSGALYKGPEWFTSAANDDIYGGIYRS
jgi:molybdopterin-guanine dinucleotide biosynthesis protein A